MKTRSRSASRRSAWPRSRPTPKHSTRSAQRNSATATPMAVSRTRRPSSPTPPTENRSFCPARQPSSDRVNADLKSDAAVWDRPRGIGAIPQPSACGGSLIWLFPETLNDEPDLFSLDVRGLEDRPPLLDLGLVVGRERLRILILARRNVLAEIGEPLAHAGIG